MLSPGDRTSNVTTFNFSNASALFSDSQLNHLPLRWTGHLQLTPYMSKSMGVDSEKKKNPLKCQTTTYSLSVSLRVKFFIFKTGKKILPHNVVIDIKAIK